MAKDKKNQNSDTEIAEKKQNDAIGGNTNGASTNGTTANGSVSGKSEQTSINSTMNVASGPAMDTELELLAETVSPKIAPVSLNRMPNGAELRGPLPNGARTFSGTFKQSGADRKQLLEWFRLMDLGRITDTAAANYLKKAMGWSYHAPCAGHEGIQLAIGVSFRQKKDYLFPYYRDLMTCLAAGLTVEEIVLNGLSKTTDVAGGGRHMSNHFAKMSLNIQTHSSLTDNQAQHTAGCARAIKYYKLGAVSIFSGGESGTSEGFFYEAVNGSTTRENTGDLCNSE